MKNRIMIVDDHEIVRRGLRNLIAENPAWTVCGEAEDGERAIRKIVQLCPDIVILDISLPLMNGFEVASEMRRLVPAVKIVFFSMHEMPSTTATVGADAFVAKSAGSEALSAALERVLQRQLAKGASQ